MTDRRHDARHPFELAPTAWLSVIAVSQLAYGPEGSRVVLSMPEWTQRTFALLLLIGTASIMVSMLVAGRTGRRIELFGLYMCAVTLGVYAMTVASITPAWLTNPALGFGGIAVASAFRAGQILRRRW